MNAAEFAELSHNQTKTGQASVSPHDLENLIECWRTVLVHETDPVRQRDAASRMRELIALRSPERVREMEIEKGLR